MRDEDKSKEQLIKELRYLRRQAGKAPQRNHPLFAHTGESDPAASGPEKNKIRLAGANIEWDSKPGACTVEDMAATMRKLEEEVADRQRTEEELRELHQKLEAVIQASPLSIFVLDPEGKVLLWNPASESTFGWSAGEVLGRVLPIVPEDKEEEFRDNLRRGLAGDSLTGVELRRRKKDGAPIDINVYTSPIYDFQGEITGLMVVDADVTERKRADELIKLNESRLEALQQLNQMTDASLSEITNFAMEEAIRLTGSKIGYIAFMNEDETVLTMHAWSKAAMSTCRIADKPLKYPVETTGLWGEAVRQRQPIVTNDYGAANPWKKGYPEGHVHIFRHMNVPIFDGQKIILVAGVGNKPADYDESDVRQLTLLMEGMWRILQRNQAEAELDQSISLLKATLESTADGLLVVDNSGKIVAYNRKFAQMWRIPEDVLTSRNDNRALSFVLEQLKDPEDFLGKVRELYGQREAESYNLIEFKDGRVFERYSQPQRIGETIVGRVWSFRDITKRRQAEEALRENREDLNRAQAVANTGSWRLNTRKNELLWSDETYRMFGIPKGQALTYESFLAAVLTEDREYVDGKWTAALHGDPYDIEHRILAHGKVKWVREKAELEFDPQGQLVGGFGTVQDITERKQADEALRESEEKYRKLMETAHDAIFIADADTGLILEANCKAQELLGLPLEQIIGMHQSQVHPPEETERYKSIFKEHAKKGGVISEDIYVVDSQGRHIPVEIGASTIEMNGKRLIYGIFRNLAAQRQAEDALRRSEETYRLLVNQIPAVVFKGYPDWSIDFFDNKIKNLAGYSKEDFDSRRLKWSDLILADDFEEIKRQSRDAVNSHSGAYEREYRIRKKDGGIAWVQAMGQRFYDAAGKLDYTSGVFFDITRRKRAEEALLNYEFIANTAKDCMTLIDRNYVYVAANAAYSRAHNKRLEEMVGASVAHVWGEETFNNVIRGYLDQCFAGRAVEFEGWFEFGKQGMGCYHVFYNPYFDANGRVVYAAVVSRDITERKKVEEALRRSEMKYRQLVDQIPAVVYKGYTDWTMDCFDEKVKAITGYSQEDFNSRRKNWQDLIFPEDVDQAKKLFREAQQGDGFYVTEHRIRKQHGQVRWIQARNKIVRDEAGKVDHISGVFFDLTERKELEDQLNKAQKMEAIGILAGGLAHDFNNLLTAIMGYGEIMSLGLRKEDPFYLYVEEINKAANRGAALTDQLLAFSRKQILQPRVINLNEVVLDMDQMLRRLIGEDIELVTAVNQELGLVKADPGQIEQIIMNLAVNARDAMPEGGILTVETANVLLDDSYARSHVNVTPGPYVMLAVSDTGLGMNTETMSRIFEPFFTTKESGKGTGLGLATAYGIVKQSGGHIWVYSEPGQGTTFKIYLPRVEEAPVAKKPKAAASASLEGKETILVVEDDTALRELIGTALRKYGFKVLEAPHGGEALLICEKQKDPIHLMLTDVVMPQISGTALAERLKRLHPEMKVLYMSGYTENAIVHHGVLDAKVNFIPKPFRVLALVEKVREVLDASEVGKNHS